MEIIAKLDDEKRTRSHGKYPVRSAESEAAFPLAWPHSKWIEELANEMMRLVQYSQKDKLLHGKPKTVEKILEEDMPHIFVTDPNTNKKWLFVATKDLFTQNNAKFGSIDPIASGRLACLGELPAGEIDESYYSGN